MFGLSGHWVWKPNGFLKLVALLINLFILCLLCTYDYEPLTVAFQGEYHAFTLTVVTVGGLIFVHMVLIVGYCFDRAYGAAFCQEAITHLVGFVLCVAVTAVLLAGTIRLTDDAQSNDFRKKLKTAYDLDFLIGVLWICCVLILVNTILILLDLCFTIYASVMCAREQEMRRREKEVEKEEMEEESPSWWHVWQHTKKAVDVVPIHRR